MYTIPLMANDAPDVLYHYTDFGGFSGIVQRRQLWATDIRYLNDAEELRFGATAMANLLHHLADEIPDLTDADRATCPDFFSPGGPDHSDRAYLGPKSAGLRAVAANIAAIADESLPQMPEGWRFGNGYVTCLKTEKDSLGQWRGYAGGDGFAIGFKREFLSDLEFDIWDYHKGLHIDRSGDGWFRAPVIEPQPVKYGSEAYELILESIEKFFRDYIASKPNVIPFMDFVLEMFNAAARFCVTIKDDSFAAEREWRLIAMFAEAMPRLSFRKGSYGTGGVVPYVEISYPPEAIGEVVIGPGHAPELRERAIHQLLEASGYARGEVNVRHSVVPFRS